MRNGKRPHSNHNREQGLTLIEVTIALFIFAIFMASFVTSQGDNLNASSRMKQEVKLKELCQRKLDEIILDPPEFQESLTLSPDKGTFEDDDSDYEYQVEFKQLSIPNMERITGQSESGEAPETGAEQTIAQKIIENMEKLIWQVTITVRHKETQFSFDASTWLFNRKAKVNVGI